MSETSLKSLYILDIHFSPNRLDDVWIQISSVSSFVLNAVQGPVLIGPVRLLLPLHGGDITDQWGCLLKALREKKGVDDLALGHLQPLLLRV